jgi:hypothetical protein
MTLIVIAAATSSASAATKAFSTPTTAALRPVGLGLRLVNLQRASAQFRSVQRRHCFIGFGGIGHFHKPETACAPRFTIGHDADFFHRTMRLENRSQF